MIKCNIEVNEYTMNARTGEDEFSYGSVQYVLNFPVLPEIGSSISITKSIEKQYEVLDIEYRTEIFDKHDSTDNLAEVEVYIIVKEI